ncbi:TonB-dependent receptor [Phenylobacterium sp. LjRoot219]|uniref:TonB-dependent receptor domain-containing protein n=1 Tax=Phenylobacterium sp. LjRoot219 TaxID=3342283 RepID=UPI003ECEFB0F
MNTTSLRARLLATSVICALAALAAAPAAAQDTSAGEVAELVVTGTRIPRPSVELPTPVTVLTLKTIEDAGPLSLGDIISRLPQTGYAGTLRANSNNFGTGAGISAIDLRGLGVSRTLVLVNGQRHVAGDLSTNAVDVNAIPPALVERVEVTTGGASAIYGSDAVTGVVNIILKDDFEGLAADAQLGGYDNGFGAKYSASITGGRNFLDDKLNVAVTGFWRKEAGIDVRNVPGANNYGLIVNPADLAPGQFDPSFRFSGAPTPNNGIPDRLYVPNVGSELTTRNGVLINAVNGAAVVFDAAGNPVPTPRRSGYNSFGFGQLPADCAVCFFPEDNKQLASPIETKGAALNAKYDLSPRLRGFVDAKFVQNDVQNDIQPSISAGEYLLRPDNAFLTPAIAAALGQVPGPPLFVFSRFLNDGRQQDIRRRTYRIVAGLSGDLDAGFADVKWDGAINYGETDTRFVNHNLRILENFAAALDSVIDPRTGQPACRINVPSAPQTGLGAGAQSPQFCVPYNPFGQRNGGEVMAYSFGTFATKDKLTQQVANLNGVFDTGRFLNLPGGPVAVAVGAEYRMERTRERNDPLVLAGGTENFASDSAGGYNVTEGYLELNAPIFRDAGPGLDELSVNAAYRGAHYSSVGDVSTYKVGGVYGPASWLKLRGTWSRAIRAPNISEAFLPTSSAAFVIADPCSVENIGANANYAANCAAAGLPPGFVATSNLSIPGTLSGNRDLDPETSKSYTVGFVLQPSVVANLAISLDYYSIRIKDAITLVEAQDIVDNCYGSSAGLDPQYCGLFTRDPARRNNISSVHTTYVNASKLFTDGFELQVNYAADVAPLTQQWRYTRGLDGRVAFSLTADYVVSLRNYPFQQNPSQVNVLEGTANSVFGNNPQLKGIAELDYSQGPLSLGWTTRYIGKQALFDRDPSAVQGSEALSIPYTEPVFYHDLAVTYRIERSGGDRAELFAGAQNLFDEQVPFTVVGTRQGLAYDLGRFLFVGARYRR